MIKLEHLQKDYGNVMPIKDLSAEINNGDVISVIGPSGTGKSTLLRCINLLDPPTGGRILLDGEDITAGGCDINKVRQKMGMVFQSFNLFGHLTVIENIMLAPMDLLGKSKQDAYDRGMELLRMVGLAEKALAYPDELSGGQKQRIAIARTLAMDPDIILFDEPTSALDPTMVGEVQSVIADLAKTGVTMMIVTHEMGFAKNICNRVFYLDEGGIYEDGTPEEIFEAPKREKTRRFIYRLKTFEVHINSRDFDFRGANTDIDNFCHKNKIPYRTANLIRSVFEEMCRQILLPKADITDIAFLADYSEKEASADITITYNGQKFDPKDTENSLAYKIVKGTAETLKYEYTENEKLNRFFVGISNK